MFLNYFIRNPSVSHFLNAQEICQSIFFNYVQLYISIDDCFFTGDFWYFLFHILGGLGRLYVQGGWGGSYHDMKFVSQNPLFLSGFFFTNLYKIPENVDFFSTNMMKKLGMQAKKTFSMCFRKCWKKVSAPPIFS